MKFVWKQSLLNSFKLTEFAMKVALTSAENVIHWLNKCYTKTVDQEKGVFYFHSFLAWWFSTKNLKNVFKGKRPKQT